MNAREGTSFSTTLVDGAAVVEARGDLDATSSRPFRAALDAAAQTGRPLVVVDLAHVSFLDSAGLSVVFAVQRQLPVSQRLALGNVPRRMLRTLRLAAVGSVVELYPEGDDQPWQRGGDDASAGDHGPS